jgi:hypothetical protein
MKLIVQSFSAIFALSILLAAPVMSRADAITHWNEITVSATLGGNPQVEAPRPGPSNLLDIAMVQIAMYDAVQAIERDYQPYCMDIPGASGSTVAAATKAAHDVLVHRFPAQSGAIAIAYQNYLLNNGISLMDAGIPVGATAAGCIIGMRTGDGSFPNPAPPPFFGGTDNGVWRPTTPNTSMATPWMAFVTPFTIKSPWQFRPGPPPALDSPAYTADYNEVMEVGSLDSATRTAEQTDMAHFWNLNYQLVWNRVIRELSTAHVANISDSSRLFALTSAAIADSAITAWDSKVAYVFWRPISAIRNGEMDGNPKTAGDPNWASLIAAPPYPDYTSGANNLSASATRALQLFFGTNEMTVNITTTNTGPTVQDTRTFYKFTDIRNEVVEARIYEGIHFRFADEIAKKQGERIAQWAYGHYFQPVEQPEISSAASSRREY